MVRAFRITIAALVLANFIAIAALPSYAQEIIIAKKKSGGTTTSCVGYLTDQTDCDYSTAISTNTLHLGDTTRLRTWSATVSGTASRVKIFFPDMACPTDGTIQVVYYNGTQLRGTGSITCSRNAWVWGTLSAYSERSLAFSSSDTIYYGYSFDYGTTALYGARAVDSTNPNQHYQAAYEPDPITISTANYQVGAIFEYTH